MRNGKHIRALLLIFENGELALGFEFKALHEFVFSRLIFHAVLVYAYFNVPMQTQ